MELKLLFQTAQKSQILKSKLLAAQDKLKVDEEYGVQLLQTEEFKSLKSDMSMIKKTFKKNSERFPQKIKNCKS